MGLLVDLVDVEAHARPELRDAPEGFRIEDRSCSGVEIGRLPDDIEVGLATLCEVTQGAGVREQECEKVVEMLPYVLRFELPPSPERPPTLLLGPEELPRPVRSEEHTSELQSRENLVCRLLLE